MKYIECPNFYVPEGENSLFLAGGITGCPDWQKEIVNLLKNTSLAILNPRRANFVKSEAIENEQITWEYYNLRKATVRLFWFTPPTLNPISLFELGQFSHQKNLFVGVHPEYSRKRDIEIQLSLCTYNAQKIYNSLEDLAAAVIKWNQTP